MVMRRQAHLWRPMGGEDRQRRGAVHDVEPSSVHCPEACKHRGGLAHGTRKNLADSGLCIPLPPGNNAVPDKSVAIEVHIVPRC